MARRKLRAKRCSRNRTSGITTLGIFRRQGRIDKAEKEKPLQLGKIYPPDTSPGPLSQGTSALICPRAIPADFAGHPVPGRKFA